MTLAGLPPTTLYAGTSFVTTELAAITAPSPMVTPPRIVALSPIYTLLHTIAVRPFQHTNLSEPHCIRTLHERVSHPIRVEGSPFILPESVQPAEREAYIHDPAGSINQAFKYVVVHNSIFLKISSAIILIPSSLG